MPLVTFLRRLILLITLSAVWLSLLLAQYRDYGM